MAVTVCFGCAPAPLQDGAENPWVLELDPSRADVRSRVKACEMGEAMACEAAASAYSYGYTSRRDAARAQALRRRGCVLGGAESCWRLERDEAIPPLERFEVASGACERGLASSCTASVDLAVDLVVQNSEGHARLLSATRRACEVDAEQCHFLADMYALGLAGERDLGRARELHARACDAAGDRECDFPVTGRTVSVSLPARLFLDYSRRTSASHLIEREVPPSVTSFVFEVLVCHRGSSIPTVTVSKWSGVPQVDAILEGAGVYWAAPHRREFPDGVTLCFFDGGGILASSRTRRD